ncbi:hypothetical protein DVH05_023280 [Phytophthora capsici]|nr:hypothetical protein DVH05_023280 [Phytophthora capsici]
MRNQSLVAGAIIAEGRLGESAGLVIEDTVEHYGMLNTLADITGFPKKVFFQTGAGRSLKRKVPFGERAVFMTASVMLHDTENDHGMTRDLFLELSPEKQAEWEKWCDYGGRVTAYFIRCDADEEKMLFAGAAKTRSGEGRVAAELDYGLVSDLLAAASVLDTPSPAPEDDCQLDVLGDITEEGLHEFLGSQSPTSLINDVSLAPKTAASTSRCVTLSSPAVSVRFPSLPPSSVAAPLSPSNSDSGESVVETVIPPDSPVRSAPMVASAVVATPAGRNETPPWFADTDQEEWEDPSSAVNLILAAQAVTERPPLADPPEFHPRLHAENLCFKANAPFDPDRVWQVRLLIDRYCELPHVAFLVEWETEGVRLTWEWPENLKGVYWCMNQVNAWVNSCKRVPFYNCLLRSWEDGLANSGHWSRFCRAQKKSFPNGVLTREIDAFFNFIRAEGVPLDYLRLFKKVQKFSMTTVAELERKACKFPDGCYIVHAAQHYVEHCFALVVNHDSAKQEFPVMIFDD